jgi:1-acyl-sn-glycerol-3-phosphate acyltransferase
VRGAAGRDLDVLAGCKEALTRGEILLIFPEGTRGGAEVLGRMKSGIARLSETFPDVPVVPVYLQGAGRVLPRNAWVPVPFNCALIVGRPFSWGGDRRNFMATLAAAFEALRSEAPPLRWI